VEKQCSSFTLPKIIATDNFANNAKYSDNQCCKMLLDVKVDKVER